RDALRHGLQNLGYSEGRNITLDVCYTQGRSDLAAQFAAELVRSDVAVIVAHFTPAVREKPWATHMNSRDPTVGRDRKINMRTYGEETMDDPISPARRTLLKAAAATLATPVAAAIAQPAAAVGHQEAKSFDLWVISDQHVGTDKAASEGIQHGLVGFRPPPGARRVDKRPYPIDGTWERYTFKVGNIRFLMMGDRNDLPYPVGRRASGGASPAGAVTPGTVAWGTSHVESAGKDEIISPGAHHMLRETTVGSGDYEGVSRNPDGTFRSGRYHGPDGAPEGASYLYFLGDKPKAQAFEQYLAARPGAIDLWLGGHTHTHPDDVLHGRSHIEQKWGVTFVNCAQLSKFHSYVTCPPMSRHFAFTSGSRLVRVRCYLHDDTHAAQGWYPNAERVVELSKPLVWS